MWRRAGTAFGLTAIGVGGSLLALTVFPFLALSTRDPASRQRRIQYVLHVSLRAYLWALHALRIIDVEIEGADRLHGLKGALIIANHPSLLDVVMIMAMVRSVQCVVKHQLWRNPFFRLTVEGAGYIRNDLDAEELVEACVATLKAGNNLIVFPEGTRSVPGRPMQMRRGFANIATMAEADIQLLTITSEPLMLHKGNPWYRVPAQRSKFRLSVGPRLDIGQFLRYRFRPLAARKLLAFVEDYYSEKLGHGRSGAGDQAADRGSAEAGRSVA